MKCPLLSSSLSASPFCPPLFSPFLPPPSSSPSLCLPAPTLRLPSAFARLSQGQLSYSNQQAGHPLTFHPVPFNEWLQLPLKQMGFEGTSSSSYYHMNNSLPIAQWTTLTDLLWPQAVAHGALLLMGYKGGSVCRSSTLFHLCCSGLVRLAQLSHNCNICFTGGPERSKDAPAHT